MQQTRDKLVWISVRPDPDTTKKCLCNAPLSNEKSFATISVRLANGIQFTQDFCLTCIQRVLWNPLNYDVPLNLRDSKADVVYNSIGRLNRSSSHTCDLCLDTSHPHYSIWVSKTEINLCEKCLKEILENGHVSEDHPYVIRYLEYPTKSSVKLHLRSHSTLTLTLDMLLKLDNHLDVPQWSSSDRYDDNRSMCCVCLTHTLNHKCYDGCFTLCTVCLDALIQSLVLNIFKDPKEIIFVLQELRTHG